MGQSNTLKGRITLGTDSEPIPFAIVLLEYNGQIITGGSTDINGVYTLNTEYPGEYNLQVQFLGFDPIIIEEIKIDYNHTEFRDFAFYTSNEKPEVAELKNIWDNQQFLRRDKVL